MDHEGVINNIDTGTDDGDADVENNGWNDQGAQWQLKAIWQTDYFRNFMNPKKSENFTALSETYFQPMDPSKGPMTWPQSPKLRRSRP